MYKLPIWAFAHSKAATVVLLMELALDIIVIAITFAGNSTGIGLHIVLSGIMLVNAALIWQYGRMNDQNPKLFWTIAVVLPAVLGIIVYAIHPYGYSINSINIDGRILCNLLGTPIIAVLLSLRIKLQNQNPSRE